MHQNPSVHTLDGTAKSPDFRRRFISNDKPLSMAIYRYLHHACMRYRLLSMYDNILTFRLSFVSFNRSSVMFHPFEIHLKSLLNLAQMCTMTLYGVRTTLLYTTERLLLSLLLSSSAHYPLNHLCSKLVCMKFSTDTRTHTHSNTFRLSTHIYTCKH